MNITYLIGNGFDLHFGLKTKYSDFYEYYKKQKCENKKVAALKKRCLQDAEFWSDLEMSLGQATQNCDDAEAYIEFVRDIQIKLAEFFRMQKGSVTLEKEAQNKAKRDLIFFGKYFCDDEKKQEIFRILPKTNEYTVNFIVFNYTDTVENIFGYDVAQTIAQWQEGWGLMAYSYEAKFGNLTHVHGTTESTMVLGVNDESQIVNKKFAEDESFVYEIVKPLLNKDSRTHREVHARDNIDSADVICIYGMSLGDSDKLWWETIGERLKNSDAYLVIFDRPSPAHFTRDFQGKQIREKKKRFLDKTALSDEEKEEIKDRIFICITDEMF